MCGIVAYTGSKHAAPILLDGLTTLEYRGYDSAGLYLPGNTVYRAVGNVAELREVVPESAPATAGIAHTRWATHGVPSEGNAHPHRDQSGKLALVHNGIIENYRELKKELAAAGHEFTSDTDSEVLAHLIGAEYEKDSNMPQALARALARVEGTYGIALMHDDLPETIFAAAMGSPIALGVGEKEMCVASDASALIRLTNRVVYLRDGEYAIAKPQGYTIHTLDHARQRREPLELDMAPDDLKKQGYPHFMLKEIMEAPEVLKNSARGRLQVEEGRAKLGGLEPFAKEIGKIKRIIIVGCGSAYYAGLVGKNLIEEYAGVPVEVALGSEFRHRTHLFEEGTALLAISQSGETADTLAAVKEAKARGLLTLGVVNVVGSTIARETDAGVYNHAGPEIGVASTKALLSQMEVLALIALFLGRQRRLSNERGQEFARAIAALPEAVERILARADDIKTVAEKYARFAHFLYIGRRYNFASAYEGALKLKEVSYIHAEGYGAGEMKHGPIAMIDPEFPTLAIVPRDSVYDKMRSNMEEIKARGGPIVAVATDGDEDIKSGANDVLSIPPVLEALSPIAVAVPLQLFAYYAGVAKGYNVDRPRNLAKSVTVE